MIALGIPTNRLVKPKTAESLLRLVAYEKNINQREFGIIVSSRGFNTSENRNYIAAKATNAGATHLFFIDDDMVFESDTLERLLEHEKDIVGCLYNTKYEVQTLVIEYLDEKNDSALFFKCGAIGTGCLLIKTDVFKKVPQPWFTYEWNDNGSIKMSHDWLFCHKAREYGYDIWCDPTIKVGHLGKKIF